MPRPNLKREKRTELLPVLARAFAELGYRRATTAELARRCGVQENILYRLWSDKKKMFIAAIEFVYEQSVVIWSRLLHESDDDQTPAERLLAYESQHHGEFGHYRIVFAGLSETDDPQVREALADMYRRYHRFIQRQIGAHRAVGGGTGVARRGPGRLGRDRSRNGRERRPRIGAAGRSPTATRVRRSGAQPPDRRGGVINRLNGPIFGCEL